MITGDCFQRKDLRICKKCTITQNSMKNIGSTPISTNLVGVHNQRKFEANPYSSLRSRKRV